eukprot:scaffold100613_cov63-Phaeocystis_antarctica.AAC.11
MERSVSALQNAIIAFQLPWYPTERPHALRRATRARWIASACATTALPPGSGWIPPLTRINTYRSLSVCMPGALGQPGCVAAMATSPGRIATPRGGSGLGLHGGGRGILISILG